MEIMGVKIERIKDVYGLPDVKGWDIDNRFSDVRFIQWDK